MLKLNRVLSGILIFVYLFSLVLIPGQVVRASSSGIVIYQVYGGGGNSGAPYHNDFIVLYNAGLSSFTITDWSLQYGSATGSFNQASVITSATIQSGQYYLVQEAAGTGGGASLPTPDLIPSVTFNMSGTAGKVLLATGTTALACGGSTACSSEALARIVDLVGYGTSTGIINYEGSGSAPATSNTTAAIRTGSGCTDTDNNSSDFTTPSPPPNPLNSASPVHYCSGSTNPAGVGAADPSTVVPGYSTPLLTLAVTPGANPPSTGLGVTCDLSTIGGSASQTFYDDTTNGDVTAGDNTFSYEASVTSSTSFGTKSLSCTISDAQARPGSASIALTAAPALASSKSASGAVDINQVFTYTLAVKNNLDVAVTNLVITDSLPAAFYAASDGGSQAGNVVRWDVTSLDSGATFSPRVGVTAPGAATTLTNSDYGAWAAEWLTRTTGSPVNTLVFDPSTITPIGTARAAGVGWTGTLRGNVTVPKGIISTRPFNIQDSTGGIYVYPASTAVIPAMTYGDVIQVSGTIKNFNGLLELDPVTSITWISSGAEPAPVVTDVASVASNQGKLVQVTGTATWSGSPPGSGGNNFSFSITDDSGTIVSYRYKTTGIDMTGFASGDTIQLTGLSYVYNNNPQIIPRRQSDLVDPPPAVKSTVPADDATGVSLYLPLSATFNKPMDGSVIDVNSFLLSDSSGPVSGAVAYDAGTKTASFTPDAPLSPQTVYVATLTTAIKDTHNTYLSAPYTWSFTTGDADTTAPVITAHSPASAATGVPLSASVVITFSEDLAPASRVPSDFVLKSPYEVIPGALSYNSASFAVTLDPDAQLLPSTLYTMTVKSAVADWAGNTLGSDQSWTFQTQAEPPMVTYLGDLHNHTGISDGAGTPTQALAAGKAAGFDFMAISDHSYAIDDSEWANTLSAVESATKSDFVALRGFEYTQGAEGHINVYNTVRHAVRTNTGCSYCDYTPNLEAGVTVKGFYQWLAITGTVGLDPAGTVMQFNHPGWINFNDWAYHPEVSSVARLEEVGNGNGTSYMFSEDQYIRSLDYGWKVGATNNADTHTTAWGTNTGRPHRRADARAD